MILEYSTFILHSVNYFKTKDSTIIKILFPVFNKLMGDDDK